MERTDTKAQAPILQLIDVKGWVSGKNPDDRNDCQQKEKWAAEDEMVR